MLAPPCFTAFLIALSITSRSPAGNPSIRIVDDGTSEISRFG
ncbi:Uncharacterised protein [Mycobacteroides abscessus subsp. abscessus]|nr:Uncharacterised protein [Mycobacteroides abscessus subsp. abscessus]